MSQRNAAAKMIIRIIDVISVVPIVLLGMIDDPDAIWLLLLLGVYFMLLIRYGAQVRRKAYRCALNWQSTVFSRSYGI